MKKISKIMVSLLLSTVFVMPISAMQNEASANNVNPQHPAFVAGEFIVKFTENPGILSLSINELNSKYRVFAMDKVFKNAENTILEHIYKFKVPETADILTIVDEYASLPTVAYAEPNYLGYLLGIPNDEYFNIQWGLHNTGQIIWGNITGAAGADIDAPEAWDIETGSPDVVIAVIDTGVDYTHPDLADNIWVNDEEIPGNGVDDDGNGYVDDIHGYDFYDDDNDPKDGLGHGTHCAGIAAGKGNNAVGIAGVTWNCTIMCVKVFSDEGDVTDFTTWATAFQYAADNGADVFSLSIGGAGSYMMNLLKDAIDYAYGKGVVLVAAAGNSGNSNKVYPAGFDDVIAVGALNQSNGRCTKEDWDPENRNFWVRGSNWGDWVDVAAPGNYVYATMPTYHVRMNDEHNSHTGQNWTQNYDFWGGTSMACPHVAGLAGLLLSHDPSLSQGEVRNIIRANGDPYISEKYMGTGRINAYKALIRYNGQPDIPETPTGKESGRTGRKYSYTTSSIDPDGDPLYYVWDWGDGNRSDPIGPFDSGEPCEVEYAWGHDGNYTITVKATDQKGGESYWSEPLAISMPLRHQTLLERIIIWILQLFQMNTP